MRQINPDIVRFLEGKTVQVVSLNPQVDEGLILFFSDGTRLEVGWNGWEGSAKLNDQEVDLETTTRK